MIAIPELECYCPVVLYSKGVLWCPMWNLAQWVCTTAFVLCGSLVEPNVANIQAAYDRETLGGSPAHDKNLRVTDASCTDLSNRQ
jgi:hypothetical protein